MNPMDLFIYKLRKLKYIVTQWIKKQEVLDQWQYYELESQIHDLHLRNFDQIISEIDCSLLKVLEPKKEDILQKEEMEWILKSWPMWIRLGDKNTNLFQSFASHRQNSNAIWEL